MKNILIGCDDLIIGAIQSLHFTGELYEDFFPIMSGGRVRFDRKKLSESGSFYKDMIVPYCQNKPLKIIIGSDSKEEIIYPNVLVVKNEYTFSTNDYIIVDEIHFAITGSK